MPVRGTGWSFRTGNKGAGAVVAIGAPKISGDVSSVGIVVVGDGTCEVGKGSKLDGVGIRLVNSGGTDGLPAVSRVETSVPVVSGFVPVNGGGI